jgi:hypothetical protein
VYGVVRFRKFAQYTLNGLYMFARFSRFTSWVCKDCEVCKINLQTRLARYMRFEVCKVYEVDLQARFVRFVRLARFAVLIAATKAAFFGRGY